MRPTFQLSRALAYGFMTAIGVAAMPIVTHAAKEPAKIGAATYDRAQEKLVIPFQGPAPRVHLQRLAPRQYVADLAGSVLLNGEAQGQRLRSPALAGWSLDQEPAGPTVRLRMTLSTDNQPRVRFDRRAGAYVVSFAAPPAGHDAAVRDAKPLSRREITGGLGERRLPRPAMPKPAPVTPLVLAPKPVQPTLAAARPAVARPVAHKPVPAAPTTRAVARKPVAATAATAATGAVARIGVPHYDAARRVLVVPLEGELKARDLDVYRLSKRWSYLDIPHARPTFTGVRYEQRQERLFQRWVMAKRPGRDTTRISFALGAPADIDVELRPDALLIAVRSDAPLLGAAPAAEPAHKPSRHAAAARPSRPAPVALARPVTTRPATERVALAVAHRNPVPAGTIETRLRRPFYDAERFGLVIPYEGRTPKFRWRERSERGVLLEIRGDVVNPAHLQPEARRHGDMGAWRFDRRPEAGILGVEMEFARPSELVVAADPERKQLLLIPQPRLHGERPEDNAAARATLSPVAMDHQGTSLFIPFEGDVPRYTVEQVNPSFAYINFERAALRADGVQFYAPDFHPTVNYWMVTQPEGTTTVRVAVALARPGAAAVFQDPANGRLVLVLGEAGPIVQASGSRTPRVPAPWPGAAQPAAPAGEPVSLNEAS